MDLKFRVTSPEHSEQIQQLLFKLGYKWGRNRNTSRHLDEQTLFAQFSDKSITYSDAEYFDQDEIDETTNFIEVLLLHPKQLKFLQKLTHIHPMIETIIQNKLYYKSDVGFLNDLINKSK